LLLDGLSGKAKHEYKSCVVFFAKLIIDGKPFKHRVDFIGDILQANLWNVPHAFTEEYVVSYNLLLQSL
jgi:hypothetical protein